jgi:MFS family permease
VKADSAHSTQHSSLFHGWIVVAGAFLVMFMGFGAAYSFGAFFEALRDEFGATRQQVSLVFALTGFLYFGLGAVSGRIADGVGPRRVIMAGGVLLGAGLLLASVTQALWQVYLTYSLCVGVGIGLSYVPSVGAVQRWFIRRRGFASGLAVAGIGLGNLLFPPTAAALVEAIGWRGAYVVLGLFVLVSTVLAALLIERDPAVRGLAPDGDPVSSGGGAPAAWGLTTGEALRTTPFKLLYLAGVSTTLGLFIPFAHIVPYARDHGLSTFTGAVILGAIGAGSAAGRLLLGGSADRLGRRQALAGSFVLMAAVLLWWLAATETWSLLLFAFLFGIGYGGFVALLPALASDYFGVRHAGALLGLLYTAAGIGTLVGPTLAGWVYDVRDSYTLPILISAAANLVAVGCMIAIGDPRRFRAARQPPSRAAVSP